MLSIDAILHPTDFSACAEAALPYALDLARRHDATLHMLYVAPAFGKDPVRGAFQALVDDEAFYQRLREEADARMRDLLVQHGASGLRTRHVHLCGAAPGEAITAYVASESIDLVVMGTHGRRGLRKLLLGSVAQEVLHQARCPVLAVPGREASPPRVRRILVPTDFSEAGRRSLAYAGELAALHGAPVDVLHVIDPVMHEALRRAGWMHQDEAAQAAETRAGWKLAAFIDEADAPASVVMAPHVMQGYPPTQIAQFARTHETGLIVMASHGRSGIERFPLGSVVERVLRTAPCPIFVTRPFGRSLLPPNRTAAAAVRTDA